MDYDYDLRYRLRIQPYRTHTHTNTQADIDAAAARQDADALFNLPVLPEFEELDERGQQLATEGDFKRLEAHKKRLQAIKNGQSYYDEDGVLRHPIAEGEAPMPEEFAGIYK